MKITRQKRLPVSALSSSSPTECPSGTSLGENDPVLISSNQTGSRVDVSNINPPATSSSSCQVDVLLEDSAISAVVAVAAVEPNSLVNNQELCVVSSSSSSCRVDDLANHHDDSISRGTLWYLTNFRRPSLELEYFTMITAGELVNGNILYIHVGSMSLMYQCVNDRSYLVSQGIVDKSVPHTLVLSRNTQVVCFNELVNTGWLDLLRVVIPTTFVASKKFEQPHHHDLGLSGGGVASGNQVPGNLLIPVPGSISQKRVQNANINRVLNDYNDSVFSDDDLGDRPVKFQKVQDHPEAKVYNLLTRGNEHLKDLTQFHRHGKLSVESLLFYIPTCWKGLSISNTAGITAFLSLQLDPIGSYSINQKEVKLNLNSFNPEGEGVSFSSIAQISSAIEQFVELLDALTSTPHTVGGSVSDPLPTQCFFYDIFSELFNNIRCHYRESSLVYNMSLKTVEFFVDKVFENFRKHVIQCAHSKDNIVLTWDDVSRAVKFFTDAWKPYACGQELKAMCASVEIAGVRTKHMSRNSGNSATPSAKSSSSRSNARTPNTDHICYYELAKLLNIPGFICTKNPCPASHTELLSRGGEVLKRCVTHCKNVVLSRQLTAKLTEKFPPSSK